MELDPYVILDTESQLRMNLISKTMKLLEETVGKLHDTGFGSDFLDMTPNT